MILAVTGDEMVKNSDMQRTVKGTATARPVDPRDARLKCRKAWDRDRHQLADVQMEAFGEAKPG